MSIEIELTPKLKEGRTLAVLIPLLLLNLTLLSIQVRDPAGTLLFRKWVLLAEAPVFNTASSVSKTTLNMWQGYIWLHGAREENRRLQESLRQLAGQATELKQLQQENLRLRSLVALGETIPYTTTGAHVVGRTPNYMANVLYVDRGSADGVRLDAPVLSGSGVIGRVVLVWRHNSQVQLITNPDASMGVLLDRTRTPGVLKGTGDPTLDLGYISSSEQVEAGDVVMTSGLDGIFPKGLMVGKVVESRKGSSIFRIIRVEPFASLLHIEEVSILRRETMRPQSSEDSFELKTKGSGNHDGSQ